MIPTPFNVSNALSPPPPAPAPKLESARAYDLLVELLLDGAIPENLPLSERNLSERLGFGRTPIREAVRDLVREGVLESHPTRGTVVRPLSIADLQDLYEIRYGIEGLAASLAAQRGAVESLDAYDAEFSRILADPEGCDLVQVHDHGVEFHMEVMRLSGNRRLLELYQPFRLRFRIPFGIVRQKRPERVLEAVREHQEILRAIRQRNAPLANELMCAHLRKGLDSRLNMLLSRDHNRA
jgi:DNA-binding GntR family transcriptional regulator